MSSEDINNATEAIDSLNLENSASNGLSHKWGLDLPYLYQLALQFYKDKEGKVIQQSYQHKLQFVALSQQVAHGPCHPEKLPPLGVLDVIGRDRRQAWQALGELSRELASLQYVELLDSVCPAFRMYAEAHKCDLQARQQPTEAAPQPEPPAQQQEQDVLALEQLALQQEQLETRRQEETKKHIQEALNQQTGAQFRAYAEQQYPGNPQQQSVLISQLQEQHYQQYMQQLYQQQLQQQQQPPPLPQQQPPPLPQQQGAPQQQQQQQGAPEPSPAVTVPVYLAAAEAAVTNMAAPVYLAAAEAAVTNMAAPVACNGAPEPTAEEAENLLDESGDEDTESADDADEASPEVGAASMWTRKDLAEFKDAIRSEGGDAVLKVGHGETVTIRVPTHEDGTCLFWEFATDSYDLGFGVFFEWGPSEDSEVTIHISESEDEDDDPENGDDPERGGGAAREDQPLTSCVIPVYRRDCHQEVYAGSHVYPGQGVYQLKFDNSYSLWRSKTLYYRVFYTR